VVPRNVSQSRQRSLRVAVAALARLRDVRTISMTALRRLVIGAQGYATRSRRGSDKTLWL